MYALPVDALGGEQGKGGGEVEAHGAAETAERADLRSNSHNRPHRVKLQQIGGRVWGGQSRAAGRIK